MSKIRTMGAGAANMSYGANSMLVQIGDKLQGLPPTTNKRAELIPHIRRRADGDKRDWIFCINQLAGGVGRHAGEFAPGADGVKDCIAEPYSTPASLFNCDVWYRLAELNAWITSDLSSMMATMSQTPVRDDQTQFYNYVGMALLPVEFFQGSFDNLAAGGGPKLTPLYYAISVDVLKDVQNDWPAAAQNQAVDWDLTAFDGLPPTTPASNYPGFSTNTGLSNAQPLIDAIVVNLNANPSVKQTIDDLYGKTFKVDGSPKEYMYVFYIFPEAFISTYVYNNVQTWITSAVSAGERGQTSGILNTYNGPKNGLTYMCAHKNSNIGLPNEMVRFTNVCDIEQFSTIGTSLDQTGEPVSIITGTYPSDASITDNYTVEEA